jgi:hypothetical protein
MAVPIAGEAILSRLINDLDATLTSVTSVRDFRGLPLPLATRIGEELPAISLLSVSPRRRSCPTPLPPGCDRQPLDRRATGAVRESRQQILAGGRQFRGFRREELSIIQWRAGDHALLLSNHHGRHRIARRGLRPKPRVTAEHDDRRQNSEATNRGRDGRLSGHDERSYPRKEHITRQILPLRNFSSPLYSHSFSPSTLTAPPPGSTTKPCTKCLAPSP